METPKDWKEDLKPGNKVLATIRHAYDGTKNKINVEVEIVHNCGDEGFKSVVAKTKDGETYRISYMEIK